MGMESVTGWTDDRVSTLKKLWLDGLSASQIAKQLGGVTRNAVIGKVHRLGLSGHRAAPDGDSAGAGPDGIAPYADVSSGRAGFRHASVAAGRAKMARTALSMLGLPISRSRRRLAEATGLSSRARFAGISDDVSAVAPHRDRHNSRQKGRLR
eukprot:gene13111-13213_t